MFAELHTKTHYTFLEGASSPKEIVYQAAELGYEAIAISDDCSFAGLVKAYQASEEVNIKLIVASQFKIVTSSHDLKIVLIAPNRTAYSELSALISKGRRRSPKGEYDLNLDDLQFGLQRCLAIWLPEELSEPDSSDRKKLTSFFRDRLWIGVGLFRHSLDQQHYLYCSELSAQLDLNMVACNDVHMHHKSRKPLTDTIHAIRLNTTVQALGRRRQINSEHYLKPLSILQAQYPQALIDETLVIADLCSFSMAELKYQYPKELVPQGKCPTQYLKSLVSEGARRRWPNGTEPRVQIQIECELKIIAELVYEYYFLTVYDIVKFAREQNILCQGRGSAANSAVCYCLHITEVDPASNRLLFERFISKERDEPPDIDVDFESQRREEVIQYIYGKYTRKRTALAATVVTYRRKSAVRDVAKALGFPISFADELNKSMAWWDRVDVLSDKLRDRQMSLDNQLIAMFIQLVNQIIGTPRHLSQHVGGFIITENPISTLVPIENASMPDRTIIQWDKVDIEILGLLKIDVLGLGMLTAIQKSLTMIGEYQNRSMTLANIPREDSGVYDMLCKGDSIGLFQVESRAQMAMLPRLKPRKYYDLVVEVAIVRPGPIQGDMVHPYLKRRDGIEAVDYPNAEIKAVLERTLGIPIFQEQVIELTMVAGGFTGGEADQLRREMGSYNRHGNLSVFREKLRAGMLKNGYSAQYAERLYKQIEGFGSYGFPESHSASFALLVYFSAWLKRYHPEAFFVALLNSQPMGFYSPSQLIQDARRHGIKILPVCIVESNWDHDLILVESEKMIRLGFCLIKGVSEKSALNIAQSRNYRSFKDVCDIKLRKLMSSRELGNLVNANAFSVFDDNRKQVYWESLQLQDKLPYKPSNSSLEMKPLSPVESVLTDYQHARGVSLKYHPMQLLRPRIPFKNCTLARSLLEKNNNSMISVAGLVTGRQRPGTASGVMFMTLEDETGNMNVVLWTGIQERFRNEVLTGKILLVKGRLEHQHGVANIIAGYLEDQSSALASLEIHSRTFG